MTKSDFSSGFRALWSSSAVSNVADGLLRTAAPLLATTLTKDPVWISTVAALVMLPWLLFAIPIGGLVDRVNRRQMLAIANAVRLSAATLLATSVGFEFITLPLLLTATFLFGVGEVIYDTTMQSMLPELLERDQLDRGNARLQITGVTLGEFVGAPLSGLLFAAAIALPFFFGAIGVLVAMLLVLAIPRNYSIQPASRLPKETSRFWSDIRFGINYLYKDKTLLGLVLLTSSIGFFFSASNSTLVLFLTQTLGAPTALFGFLFATPALGAIAGSVLAPRAATSIGRTTAMAWAILLSSFLVILQGFSPNYWALAALTGLGSLFITVWNVLLMSTYHQIIPTELFGRIHGTRRTLVWGLMPIGALLGGVFATFDLRAPFWIGGLACTLLSLMGFRFIRRLQGTLLKGS